MMEPIDNNDQLPDPQDVRYGSTAIRYGLYTGLVLVAISLLMYLLGMSDPTKTGQRWISLVITVLITAGGMVLANRYHRDEELGGVMNFGRGFGVSMLVGVAASLVSAIYSYLFLKFIDPTVMDKAMEMQRQQMEGRGMTDEQIEQASKMMDMFSTPGFASLSAFISSIIFALIISLVVAAIMQRRTV
ncbi:MAG: DUF4199 domain-containing protein [Saprospiraceae bacterium]|nr:DUF4199 domain-containing protein [Saprospiraceae bacterium]